MAQGAGKEIGKDSGTEGGQAKDSSVADQVSQASKAGTKEGQTGEVVDVDAGLWVCPYCAKDCHSESNYYKHLRKCDAAPDDYKVNDEERSSSRKTREEEPFVINIFEGPMEKEGRETKEREKLEKEERDRLEKEASEKAASTGKETGTQAGKEEDYPYFCGYCKEPLKKKEKFCPACGQPLEWASG